MFVGGDGPAVAFDLRSATLLGETPLAGRPGPKARMAGPWTPLHRLEAASQASERVESVLALGAAPRRHDQETGGAVLEPNRRTVPVSVLSAGTARLKIRRVTLIQKLLVPFRDRVAGGKFWRHGRKGPLNVSRSKLGYRPPEDMP
jgi:hypothetical protein